MKEILVVDDEAIIRKHLCALIKQYCGNVDIYEAKNGLQGLDKAIRLVPEIIIVDINMPKLDGPDMIAHYHKACPGNNTQIYLFSASPETLLNQAEVMAGYIDGIIQKNCSLDAQIMNLAKQWLGKTNQMYW
jgi:CheY-like chemotaxis protein